MAIYADQIPELAVAEVRNCRVSFADKLDKGTTNELLTGTPTIAEQTTSDLTISNVSLNSAAVTMFGESIAANKVVQFKVIGQQANTVYEILVTASSDASPAQTFKLTIRFRVV